MPLTRYFFALFLFTTSQAADLRVDPDVGDDANHGSQAPLKTIAKAIEIAKPGDTIHLKPGTYYETVDLSNKHGAPGKPIVLDGHGAVIDGSRKVGSDKWRKIQPGFYRGDYLYSNYNDEILWGFFIVWNGKMNRMYRCPKAVSDPFWSAHALRPGKWTYSRLYDAFFIFIDPNKSLEQANLRYPVLRNAVRLGETGSWLTIKNLGAVHVYNDGFSISGNQTNIVFESVSAMECGDDGFSVEGNVECSVSGLVSIGNGTGILDASEGRTHYRGVLIKECIAYDLLLKGKHQTLENGMIESEAGYTLWMDGKNRSAEDPGILRLKNMKIVRVETGNQQLRIGEATRFEAENCQFSGLDIEVEARGRAELRRCKVHRGDPRREPPVIRIASDAEWAGQENRYDLEALQFGESGYSSETFGRFQELLKSERGTTWINTREQ